MAQVQVQVQANALGVAQSESNWWEEACWEKEDARDVIPGKTQRVPVKRRPESLDGPTREGRGTTGHMNTRVYAV
jgi:hypothetical protein